MSLGKTVAESVRAALLLGSRSQMPIDAGNERELMVTLADSESAPMPNQRTLSTIWLVFFSKQTENRNCVSLPQTGHHGDFSKCVGRLQFRK